MKFRNLCVYIMVMLLLSGGVWAKKKSLAKQIKELSPKYRKWITQDVGYIITKTEKQVFIQLDTDRQREVFMKAFWDNRDPDPNTLENEFKTEHYRRLRYANEKLGRGTPTPGWRTEMGRIYIILGPPQSITRYEHETQLYPTIIWFYQGMVQMGLPNAFSVVFFKQHGSGDYILYSPVSHGPRSLLVNYFNDLNNIQAAYEEVWTVQPDLAKVSMSLIEDEHVFHFRPSVASEILISKKISEVPTKRISDGYAKNLLKYKSHIGIEESINFIKNRALVQVIQDKSSIFHVHYAIEPEKFSMEQRDDVLATVYEIVGNISDMSGGKQRSIYEFSKTVPIQLKAESLRSIGSQRFSFQDVIPVIEGEYTINLLVKNIVSKEFTSVERKISIPGPGQKPEISSCFLASKMEEKPSYRGKIKPYLFDELQVLPAPKNDFTASDTLHVSMQLTGMQQLSNTSGCYVSSSIYRFSDSKKALRSKKTSLDRHLAPFNLTQSFKLDGLIPNDYRLLVTLYNGSDQVLAQKEALFFVSFKKSLSRPWVYSLSYTDDAPEQWNILGIQWAKKGEAQKALPLLAKAYHKKPQSLKFALDYTNMLHKTNQFDKAIRIAQAFLDKEEKHRFYVILAHSYQGLKDFTQAISFFKKYLTYYGANISILNSIGKCYYQAGNTDEALVAWEKSLQLMPEQLNLKKLVQSLKREEAPRCVG